MNYFHALILSLVEGITEFLPISSTAHLILTSHILKLAQTEFLSTFEIVIQLGAILAVALLYGKKLIANPKLILIACISFLPTGILGFLVYPLIKGLLSNDTIPVIALFIGGIFLMVFERKFAKKQNIIENDQSGIKNNLISINISKGILIGLIQSLAMIPGVSRSAASIVGGMILGLDRKSALEFSFILAIPTMCAATGYDLLKSYKSISADEFGILLFGVGASCVFAIIAVKWLTRYVQTNTFTIFGIYRIVFALVYAVLFLHHS